MAQGIFLHEYNTGGKLYDGSVSDAANRLANRQYVTDNAALKSNNLSDLANAATARTNLGVAIGSDVQAYSARLGELSSLSQSDGSFVVSDGSSFVFESGSTARASLGAQQSNARLDDISGLGVTDGAVVIGDGSNLVLESGATARASLGLAIGSDVLAYDAEVQALAGLTSAANKIPMFSGSGTATVIDFLDEDGMASDSATAVPSQQSVKAYVEAHVQGLDVKRSVRVATTANLASTYNSSAQTLTMSSAGVLTIDGGNIALNDRILVKDQSTGTQNGIYACTTAGVTSTAAAPDDNASVSGIGDDWDTVNTISIHTGALGSGAIEYDDGSVYIARSQYQGSTVTIPAGAAVQFSDGTDTMTLRNRDVALTVGNGSSFVSMTTHLNHSYVSELSTITSISPSNITSITVYPKNDSGLKFLLDDNGTGVSHTTTSMSLTSTWPQSTVSSPFFIRYEPVNSQVYYWKVDADIDNGDSTVSVEFDSTNSYATTISNFFLPLSRTNQTQLSFVGSSSVSSGTAAVLTRAADFDEDSEVTAGAFTFVEEGTVNDNSGFVLSTDEPFAIDTDSISFTQFSGAGQITAGTGLSKSGNTIAADGNLADVAGLSTTDGGIIVGDGSNFVLESGATARTSLGVSIGSDVLAYDASVQSIADASISSDAFLVGNSSGELEPKTGSDARASMGAQQSNARLDDISGLAVTDGGVIVGNGSNFVLESGATARASLDAQQQSDILDDIAGVTQAANKGVYFDSASTAATFDLTSAGRALLDDADAAAQRSTLGLGSIATQASSSVSISGGSISGITDLAVADGGTGASSAAAARANLSAQESNARLDDIAGLTPSDSGFIVGDGSNFVVESAATARASLNVDVAGTDNSTDVSLASVSGNYLSLSGQEITASTVPLSLGGTGATTVSAAQQALDLEPGVDIQEYDAELAALAGLTSAANKIPMFSGSGTATLVDFLDEDDMNSDSATGIPSQQSVKAFVQAQVQGLDIKDSARLASTANVAGSYSNGVLTLSSAGVLSIDGESVALNDRVLLKDQSTGSQNGIYKCTTAGAVGVAAVLTRAADFDSDADISSGAFCFIEEGTVNDNAGFVLVTDEAITLDSTALSFTQFSGAGQITAGTGLSKSGNTISASGTLADIAGLAVTDGGIIVGDGSNFVLETGSTARASLDAQQSNARLDDISALAVTDGGIIVGDGSNFVLESGATARASLDAQQRNDILDDLAGLTQAADKGMYFDSSSTAATFDLTAAGRALLDDASASAQRATLGLVLGTDAQRQDSKLQSIADASISSDAFLVGNSSGELEPKTGSDARSAMNAQERSDILDDIAGVTQAADKAVYFDSSSTAATFDLTSAARALLDDADAAAMRATLGLVIGTDVAPADSSEMAVDTSEPSSLAVNEVSGMYVYDLSGASTSATVTLPSTATSGAAGKSVIFKIKSTVGSSSSLTISPASNQTIEGESSIVLNQERQSIRLVISEEYSGGSGVQCWVAV